MSTISAKDVKRLRDTTGVGMMDCKKALEEANGSFEEAIELLRKKGQKVADKRAEREASEGVITTATTDDHTVGRRTPRPTSSPATRTSRASPTASRRSSSASGPPTSTRCARSTSRVAAPWVSPSPT